MWRQKMILSTTPYVRLFASSSSVQGGDDTLHTQAHVHHEMDRSYPSHVVYPSDVAIPFPPATC